MAAAWLERAATLLARCDVLACFSEEPGRINRLSLTPALEEAYDQVRGWMEAAALTVRLDAAGNLVGSRPGPTPESPRVLLGSHLDSVRDAGRYDGVLGVLAAVAVAEAVMDRQLPFGLEVVGFCDEEGVRFGRPFLGSLALAGAFAPELLELRDPGGTTLGSALAAFGGDPDGIAAAAFPPERLLAYLELHIEQGPRLADLGEPLAIVSAITGASWADVVFTGSAGHAGTTPMEGRRDALTGAAAWLLAVERYAGTVPHLVATVGKATALPGAANVIPGEARLSLDVRHPEDPVRLAAMAALRREAEEIARDRGLTVAWSSRMDQPAVPLDARLRERLRALLPDAPELPSGAGHDAMVMARSGPAAMLFVRSPNGISHHPDEQVEVGDVARALEAMVAFLLALAQEPPDEHRGAS